MEQNLIDAMIMELSGEILDNIKMSEVIYAEAAFPGAMGRVGTVMLYIIENDKLIRYETNIFNNEDLFLKAEAIIRDNAYHSKYFDYEFFYFDGSMGNDVYINKNISLEIGKEYFIYNKDNKRYRISSSCLGVFDYLIFTYVKQ
jgi:hypothetical protein